jgi:large subunit ribosomal protein L9
MKVLFLKDVRPTARAGELKEVKNGFARNYLIPQKLAVLATSHEIARAEGLRKEAEARRKQEAAEWREIVDGIKEEPIKVIVRTGPTGRLYGSVTAAMIATEIQAVAGRDVDRRSIRIPAPIRTIGKYSIPVQFADGLDTSVDVVVQPDEGSIERMEMAKIAKEENVEDAEADPTFAEALEQDPEQAAAKSIEATLDALSAESSKKSS